MAPQLTPHQRQLIIELRDSGYRIKEIERRTGITGKSIRFWLKRNEETGGDLTAHHRQLYQRATTAAQDADIIAAHEGQPFLNTRKTATQYNVSTATIRRRLKAAGFLNKTPGNRKVFSPAHAQARALFISSVKSDESEKDENDEDTGLPTKTVTSQPQRTPVKLPFSSSDESDNDQVDEDDSIYERDVSPIKTEGSDGEATVPEGSSRRHEGYRCDVCRGDIVGYRYACVQCANFDLCSACEARGEHATHYVLRVPPIKLYSDVQAVINKIREQLLQENLEETPIKVELKEEVLEEDPLERTTSPATFQEKFQETSCQDKECEQSEDTLAVKFLGLSEEGKQPIFEVSISHQPSVPQDQPQQSKQKLQVPSYQPAVPQVLSHQPAVPQVLAHKPAVPQISSHQTAFISRQPKIFIQQPKVLSAQSKVPQVLSHQLQDLSHQPRVLSHQPQVPPAATSQETRPQTLEATAGTAAGGDQGGGKPAVDYAVYTHRADPSIAPAGGHDAPSAEQSFTDTESKPTRKKRKK